MKNVFLRMRPHGPALILLALILTAAEAFLRRGGWLPHAMPDGGAGVLGRFFLEAASGTTWELSGLVLSAWGLYFAQWRLARNRPVAVSAALLFGVHPWVLGGAGLARVTWALLAWVLAIQSRPRVRSPRFPNRTARAFHPIALLGFLGAVVLVKGVWPFGFLLPLFDLALRREPGRRPGVDLMGHVPWVLVALAAGIIEGTTGRAPWGSNGISPWVLLTQWSHPALTGAGWLWLALPGGAAAVGLFLGDILLGWGDHRTLVRWCGVGGVWLLGTTALAFAVPPPWRTALTGVAWLLPAMTVAVVLWRIVVALLPGPPSVRPAWTMEEGPGLDRFAFGPLGPAPSTALPPEPPPQEIPPPFSPELEHALEFLGQARAWRRSPGWVAGPPGLVDGFLSLRMLALLSPNSIWAGRAAARAEDLWLLRPTDEEIGECAGLEGVREGGPSEFEGWSIEAESLDSALLLDGWDGLDESFRRRVLDLVGRAISRDGRVLIHTTNAASLRKELAEAPGLEIVEETSWSGGSFMTLTRRDA